MKFRGKFSVLLFASVIFLGMNGVSNAYTLAVNYDNGTTNVTTDLTGFSTNGAQMDGMNVTAFFSGGGSETLSWADIDSDSGGVSGTGWSLREDGNTFGGTWTLLNRSGSAITSILIDAGVGDTVFDIDYNPYPGTPGSADGWTFDVQSGTSNDLDIVATYRDVVALSGNDPVGDIWRFLEIGFTNAGYFDAGSSLRFIADTDNIKFAGDIQPQPVPEPATMLLLGTGLIGLTGFRRKFRKK